MAVVLIVEDDLFLGELTEMTVQEIGFETLSASNVADALSLIYSGQNIDLLFTDINLNNDRFGGCDLARKAVMYSPRLNVLYTTGNIMSPEMTSMFVKGARCLAKPYTPNQLQAAVQVFFCKFAQKTT